MCCLEVSVGRCERHRQVWGGVLQLSGEPWWTWATRGDVTAPNLPRRMWLWSLTVDVGGSYGGLSVGERRRWVGVCVMV
jgi:hypothetical protein